MLLMHRNFQTLVHYYEAKPNLPPSNLLTSMDWHESHWDPKTRWTHTHWHIHRHWEKETNTPLPLFAYGRKENRVYIQWNIVKHAPNMSIHVAYRRACRNSVRVWAISKVKTILLTGSSPIWNQNKERGLCSQSIEYASPRRMAFSSGQSLILIVCQGANSFIYEGNGQTKRQKRYWKREKTLCPWGVHCVYRRQRYSEEGSENQNVIFFLTGNTRNTNAYWQMILQQKCWRMSPMVPWDIPECIGQKFR